MEAALTYAAVIDIVVQGTEAKVTALGDTIERLSFQVPFDVWIPRDEALALVDRIDRELGS